MLRVDYTSIKKNKACWCRRYELHIVIHEQQAHILKEMTNSVPLLGLTKKKLKKNEYL